MDDASNADMPEQATSSAQRGIVITIVVLIAVGLLLLAAAILLAANAQDAGPGVRVVRDLLIIVMSLEIIIVGAAFTLFLIQLARLVNLIHNEVEPLIDAASETVNTVRGTAAFLSKNLVEPVTAVNSTLRGVSKVVGDVDAIRKAAGVVMSAANVAAPYVSPVDDPDDDPAPRRGKTTRRASKPGKVSTRKKTGSTRKRQEED